MMATYIGQRDVDSERWYLDGRWTTYTGRRDVDSERCVYVFAVIYYDFEVRYIEIP